VLFVSTYFETSLDASPETLIAIEVHGMIAKRGKYIMRTKQVHTKQYFTRSTLGDTRLRYGVCSKFSCEMQQHT
jgi:hypothetical protein